MVFTIIPTKAVGKIPFGLPREEVKNILSGFSGSFKKSKFSKNTTDDFGYCHVYYDDKDRCTAIEFFEKCELIYDGVNLFEQNATTLKKLFSDIKEEYGSYISVKYSIGIVMDNNTVESILIGKENYYCL